MQITRLDRKEALTLYKEKTGREITYHGLFYLAKRFNFLEKGIDEFHYCYLKEKMEVYLTQILQPTPDGFFTTRQLAKKHDLSYAGVYYLVNTYNLKPFEHGSRKIKMYSEKEFQKVYKGNKNG